MKIRELKSKKEMFDTFFLIKQLNPQLKKSELNKMLDDMLINNYRMAGVFINEKCVAVSGFWISTKIYSGKYVELDNVVVDKDFRSKGAGKKLCDWIIAEAKKCGCKMAMLDAYVKNSSAHQFYFREGYKIKGFHFLKKI